MTRESEKSRRREFNTEVYTSQDMAKKTVSTRLPLRVAEQVDRYAETHEISRTKAIEVLAREGVENPENAEGERAYTGVIPDELVEQANLKSMGVGEDTEAAIRRSLNMQLRPRKSVPDEFDETVARSARLPKDLAGRLIERAESQDSSKATVTAEAIEVGLKADPIPMGTESEKEGRLCTVVLDRETAELFRKYRLGRKKVPGEVFESALMWTNSSRTGGITVRW